MGEITVRYLEMRRLADGTDAYYYCPPRDAKAAKIVHSIALGADPVEAARKAEIENAKIDAWRRHGEPETGPTRGSVAWLCIEYERSEQFRRLSKKTRDEYLKCLKVLKAYPLKSGRTFGDAVAATVEPGHADKIYARLLARDAAGKPTKLAWANAIMRVARRVWYLGIRWRHVTINPFAKMEMTSLPSRTTVIPLEHVESFSAKAIEMNRRSMAIYAWMAFELCQREEDVLVFPWTRYDGMSCEVRQKKTDAMVWVPLLPDCPHLKRMLDETRKESPIIIISETTGAPYKEDNFRHIFREICRAAGLPDHYQARDFRRSGLDETGDAGGTDDELRSLSGHATREVVSVYVKANRTKAASAMKKRAKLRRSRRKSQMTPGGVSK